jgi:hypothetical protein
MTHAATLSDYHHFRKILAKTLLSSKSLGMAMIVSAARAKRRSA